MRPNALSREEKRELIERAERYHGLAPGSGSAGPLTRSYPDSLVPPKTSGGLDGDAGRAAPRQSIEEAVSTCWSLQRCLVILADAHASLNLRLTIGPDKEKIVTSGAAYDLLETVNPHWDPAMLWGMTSMAMDTSPRGCFWILDGMDGQGRPTEIWWAAPGTVTPVRGDRAKDAPEDWYISHYMVKTAGHRGKGKRYDRDRVVWIHSPNVFNEFEALPPVMSALESAGLSLAAMHANKMLFETGMTGAGYVVPEDGVVWTDDEQAEVGRMFSATVKGRAGWHRVLVANRADFQVRDLKGLSPREVQFIQMLGLTQSQVCIAMGVPEPLLSPTDTTFANAREARRTLWENTVIPRDKRIAAAIKSQLLVPHFSGEADDCWFDHGEVPELQGDHAAKWALDKDQLAVMTQLARDVQAGILSRDGALQAAAYFVGAPEELALAMMPALVPLDGADAPNIIALPPLMDLRLLLAGVTEGTTPRGSAIAILEATTGSRQVAEAIVADAGTATRTIPLPLLEFARQLVKEVVAGTMPRASAMALMAEALGASVKATAVLADAAPLQGASEAAQAQEGGSAVIGASLSAPAPRGPRRAATEGAWASRDAGVVVYRGGRGFMDGAETSAPPLAPAAPLQWVDPETDVRVYGSRAHRSAWEDEMAKQRTRQERIRKIAAKLLSEQTRDAKRGLDGITEDQLAALVEAQVDDPASPSPESRVALALALSGAVLGRTAIPRWTERGATAMEAGLRDVAAEVASETFGALGVDAVPDLGPDSPMTRALRARAQMFAESTANTSWNSVGDLLARGVLDGKGLKEMAASISGLDERWQGSRAETIALTETHAASQEVTTAAARESGVVASRSWLSALDDLVRDDHRDAHGQTVGINEPFVVGGEKCDAPGLCPSPEQSIGCRCVQLLVLA